MNKPATQSPLYTPTPLMTTTNTIPAQSSNVLRFPSSQAISVPSSSSSSSLSSSRARWSTCAEWLSRSRSWVSRRRYELTPAAATSTLTILGLAQDGIGTAVVYGLLAVGSGAAGVLGLKHKNEIVTHIGAGGFIALADITTGVAAGFSWPTLTAWALSTGAGYAVYGPWLAQQRNARMKLHVDTVKAKGAVLPASMGLEAADPGLIGSSPEETALRRALHALVGATPQDIPAFTLTGDGGFVALVRMPAGKNTSPDAIIKKRQQLANNLGLPGTLDLKRGDADNELVVRLTTSDALAGTIAYSDDGRSSIKDPVRLGIDERGNPVEINLLYRHTLVAGASDWGKSGIINLIIKRLARRADVDIYGIDMKPGAVELGPWEPLMKKLARTPEEARDLIEWLGQESDRRGAILEQLSLKELSEGREPIRKWIPGVHGNAIVVITDELAELIRQDAVLREREKEERAALKSSRGRGEELDLDELIPHTPIAKQYESRLAIDRFLAISYVSATQQPSRQVFGGNTDARGNYANRISTRTGERGHAPFIFGQGCQTQGWNPETLDLPGKFLIATPELNQPRESRAEYVTDLDIATDVGHLHARAVNLAAFQSQPDHTTPAVPLHKPQPAPEQLRYPDGTHVASDEWPDLYREFQRLGSATKDELTEVGPFASRDTVRRAIAVWEKRGVQSRREGRSTRYYLPDRQS